MNKNKFISLLKKLSKQEIAAFHKHLGQNHPREKIGLGVFEQIISFYPDFDKIEQKQLAHIYQNVFHADFEQDGHARKKIQNTTSDLYKWLKSFLIGAKAQQDDVLQQTIWLRILQERGMTAEFSRNATKFYQETCNTPFRAYKDALPNWMASYFYREKLAHDNPFIQAKIIAQCTETMTDCWEIIRLKMACEMTLVNNTAQHLPAEKTQEVKVFLHPGLSILKDIYEALWRLTDSGEALYFIRLESLLHQHGQHLNIKELDWIIRYAVNFTAKQSRTNQDDLNYERMHHLHKIGLKHGTFLREGYLPSSAFGNIVTIACLTKDFEWAKPFIEENSHIIVEHNREEAILLAKAVLAFETNRFQEVISLLESVAFKTQLDTLRSNSLLLRSQYELNTEQYIILDNCTYFENLLRRSPKTESVKAMLAFTLILKRIVTQKSSKKVILERIKSSPDLYSRKWLLEKIVAYEPKYAAQAIK